MPTVRTTPGPVVVTGRAFISGFWYCADNAYSGDSATLAGNADTLLLNELHIPNKVTLNALAAEVTTAGDASATIDLGLYSFVNGTLTLVASAVGLSAAAVGVVQAAINAVCPPGIYFLGCAIHWPTTAPAMRTRTHMNTAGGPIPGNANFTGYWVTGVTAGNLPASISAASLTATQLGTYPKVLVKVA